MTRRGRGRASSRSALPVLLGVVALVACDSPEAERVRGGGPGADLGNRSALVQMHRGAEPYAGTPCLASLEECTGPLPVSGRITDRNDDRRESRQ